MLSPEGPWLISSAETMRTGRPPICSRRCSSRGGSASQTSPRDGRGTLDIRLGSTYLGKSRLLLPGRPFVGVGEQLGHARVVLLEQCLAACALSQVVQQVRD